MATMTVSLPTQMKEWVESLTKNGEYSSSSDYVRDLIRRDKGNRNEAMSMEELNELLEESIASGVSKLNMKEIFTEAQKSLQQQNEY